MDGWVSADTFVCVCVKLFKAVFNRRTMSLISYLNERLNMNLSDETNWVLCFNCLVSPLTGDEGGVFRMGGAGVVVVVVVAAALFSPVHDTFRQSRTPPLWWITTNEIAGKWTVSAKVVDAANQAQKKNHKQKHKFIHLTTS